MNRIFDLSAWSVAALCLLAMPAQAIFESRGLNPAFCQNKAVRQTVVYVDDMIMIDGRVDWAKKLMSKLEASLAPGERTTVVQLSAAGGQSSEVWSGCWPAYTREQENEIAKQSWIIKKNPLDELPDQRKYFVNDFGGALTKIYQSKKRPESEVRFAAAKAPRKQILRGIASDEGRFSNSDVTVRAIVYSDMVENSDLGSVINFAATLPDYAAKLGTHLRRSVFYVFGVGLDVSDSPTVQENAKSFWSRALKTMSANIGGFGADLNVPNRIPIRMANYELSLRFDDQVLDGKLSVLVDSDGNLIDTWMGFDRLGITGLSGTFRCDGDACALEAKTTSNLTSNSPTEDVSLSGKANKLNGNVGIKGTKLWFKIDGSTRG